jgi:hypothetical protein
MNTIQVGNSARTAATAPIAEPQGMVGEYCKQTEDAIARAHANIDGLFQRLAMALKDLGPTADASKRSEPPMASPFAERIRSHVVGVDAIATRIAEIVDRLDL